jgi:hypothetical protein
MQNQVKTISKRKLLVLSLLFDAIGMLSYIFPPIDFIWAPLSSFLMLKLYKGDIGKIGAVVSFIEEAVPGLSFVPSFTIVWVYVHFLKKN